MENLVANANQNILELEEELKLEKRSHGEYRIVTNKEMKRRQKEEESRAQKDLATNNSLANRIKFLTTLTSSYVQGLYEQCIAQEELVLLEDPFPRNDRTKKEHT